ncbi:hypothetical protein IPL85_00335 [Candidatus Saccharibacteria bacterium]|nr:MAG: hypothetical protein IPL85_00335 [Candidatus Saccharibacteria bacterium]
MLSLEAIQLDPQLKRVPKKAIIIVGSVTLALYKELAGIEKADRYLSIDDLDICVDETVYDELYLNSKPKALIRPGDDSWVQNRYRNVETLRREHKVDGLKRLVQLDVGPTVFRWSHEEVLTDAVMRPGKDGNDYSILNPLRQLAWYEALGRKKDQVKIEMLRDLILPRFADREDLTLPIPPELSHSRISHFNPQPA